MDTMDDYRKFKAVAKREEAAAANADPDEPALNYINTLPPEEEDRSV